MFLLLEMNFLRHARESNRHKAKREREKKPTKERAKDLSVANPLACDKRDEREKRKTTKRRGEN